MRRAAIVLLTLFCAVPRSNHGDEASTVLPSSVTQLTQAIVDLVAHGGGSLLRHDDFSDKLPEAARAWLDQRRESLLDAQPSPFPTKPEWGTATCRDNKLFLHISSLPDNRRIKIPCLHNSVRRLQLLGEVTELSLQPNLTDWEIVIPKGSSLAGLPATVELVLDAPPQLRRETAPSVSENAGNINLHSRYAIPYGKMLRFEPQSHKDTVGYWVEQNDWIEWTFETDEDGTYEVQLRYGCGDGQGGSVVDFRFGNEALSFEVVATGGFQAWKDVVLGRIHLAKGAQQLQVRPKFKAKNAVMDIQQIILTRTP